MVSWPQAKQNSMTTNNSVTQSQPTLKDLVVSKKCRKGKAAGITKNGAFWDATEKVMIRSYGGDGIGNNAPDWRHFLHLRHFRNGDVKAVVQVTGWHQNGCDKDEYRTVDITSCTTVEDVVVALKNASAGSLSVYSDNFQPELTEMLVKLGLAETVPAPDEQ